MWCTMQLIATGHVPKQSKHTCTNVQMLEIYVTDDKNVICFYFFCCYFSVFNLPFFFCSLVLLPLVFFASVCRVCVCAEHCRREQIIHIFFVIRTKRNLIPDCCFNYFIVRLKWRYTFLSPLFREKKHERKLWNNLSGRIRLLTMEKEKYPYRRLFFVSL